MTARLELRAVVVAGGLGKRFGAPLPKQFHLLAGRPVLFWGAEAIARLENLREIVFVLPPGELPREVEAAFSEFERSHAGLALKRVTGGERRQDSVTRGLRAFSGTCDVALIHDAARPFPPVDAMRTLAARAWEDGGAILAVPATDTVKQADGEGRVAATLDRRTLWLAQTPQALRGEFIERLCLLLDETAEFTDESAALEALGIPVALVEGALTNFKITTQDDLARAETFNQRS
jgi:2-C-methyl-D-erythritol 4-phosphate cytidylyltransferase/2-C-methyl-D-erythritol 2,4-cyclodiphosphate synthase